MRQPDLLLLNEEVVLPFIEQITYVFIFILPNLKFFERGLGKSFFLKKFSP